MTTPHLTTIQKQLLADYKEKRQDFLWAISTIAPATPPHIAITAIKCSYAIPADISAYQAATDVITTCSNNNEPPIPGFSWIHQAKNMDVR